MKLKFSINNKKLRHGQAIFDLPAGHSCPFALLCRAVADKLTGKISDGHYQTVRCYAASIECAFPAVRRRRWANFECLKACESREQMAQLILKFLPKANFVRVHSSGDFFSQDYFDAWMDVARAHPNIVFYAYTKALPFWVLRLGGTPFNFRLNASYGGVYDRYIPLYNLKSVTIVNSEDEARRLNLEIDHDDSHAWQQDKSFALLLHGNGPKGTLQAKLHNQKMRKAN